MFRTKSAGECLGQRVQESVKEKEGRRVFRTKSAGEC